MSIPTHGTERPRTRRTTPARMSTGTHPRPPAPGRSGAAAPGAVGTVIGADSTLAQTVDRIMRDMGLDRLPARE